MRRSSLSFAWLFAIAVLFAAIAGACSTTTDDQGSLNGEDTGGFDPDGIVDDSSNPFDVVPGGDAETTIDITPLDATVDVTIGTPVPTLAYTATSSGKTIAPAWSIDRGEIGTIDAATGVFTPGGKIGGKASVTATYAGKKATTSVTVKLHMTQNGDPDAGKPVSGAGGNGGVGGEGPGAAVSAPTKTTLDSLFPTVDPALGFLYPYDQTVWPRGILAPLLQWKFGSHSFDAVRIQIKESFFEFNGYFAKTKTPFSHHPVPQAVWKTMAYSNGGEDVTVTLVFSQGATAFGPITQTWKIAKGSLKGTVYYNSYGTALAKNYCCTTSGARFGGATLAIKGGSIDPTLVSGSDSACRVCHSVAANGSRLITQQDAYATSSAVDLKTLVETTMSPGDGRFAWPALSPDGTFLFSNSGPLPGASAAASQLFAVPSGAAIAATGIPAGLRAACPAFSPDGKHVAFNNYGADGKSLAALDFDPATKAFSAMSTLYTPTAGTVVWPAWLPSSDAIVFELETTYNGRDFAGTRSTCDASGGCSDSGTRAELWWYDVKSKTAKRLDKLNGVGYLPSDGASHAADATLNYEPTVNPVASGGYAWVVFTSRRMYGNVATINPFWSDPRFHDISGTPTTKKLWVAAIDLSAPGGVDPSHPPFYLPAQELLAGNSRGYWVVDPCKVDTSKCETGDECCGGFCQPDGAGGFTCGSKPPPCATEFEKCTTDADCCGSKAGLKCIGGRCTLKGPA